MPRHWFVLLLTESLFSISLHVSHCLLRWCICLRFLSYCHLIANLLHFILFIPRGVSSLFRMVAVLSVHVIISDIVHLMLCKYIIHCHQISPLFSSISPLFSSWVRPVENVMFSFSCSAKSRTVFLGTFKLEPRHQTRVFFKENDKRNWFLFSHKNHTLVKAEWFQIRFSIHGSYHLTVSLYLACKTFSHQIEFLITCVICCNRLL